MADSTTTDLLLTLMGDGLHNNSWGDVANANFQRLDDKLVKRTALAVTGGTVTLTSTQELVALLDVSGVLVSGSIVEFSGRKGVWIVKNGTSGAFSLTARVTGQTGVTVAQGTVAIIYCDGTDIRSASAGLADPGANGLVARTASGTTAARTLTGPAAGITVTNGDGVSGNPTLALANDLAAYEGLAAAGMVARTADGAAAARTITATAPITVANGDGVVGAPAIAATVASAADFQANSATKLLQTDNVWSAAGLVSLTDAGTIAVDMSTGLNFTVTLGGNRTLGNPTNTKVGQCGVIYVVQSGGSNTLAYGGNYKFAAGTAPTLSTAAGAVDRLTYFVRSSSHIDIDASLKRS